MQYSIGEFSKITGLGIHTLRYYEKEQLIIPKRNASGRRCYSQEDVAWIAFVKRLKDTNMPIKEIKQYAAMRAAGNNTLVQRLDSLTQHRQRLYQQIACQQEHLRKLDEKILVYQEEIKRYKSET